MPKMKTKKSAAKRFSFTGSGKIKRKSACTSHILTKMSQKRKRNLRGTSMMSAADVKSAKQMLPYG
jgi:large subunit ribosomal protein L35